MGKRKKLKATTFRLSEATVKKIDLLITKGIFVSRGEAIREALDLYFNGTARRWLEMYYRRRRAELNGL
ncbi:MAG: ribbon-helix-helix domain-containing protein [Thermoproteus sp.]